MNEIEALRALFRDEAAEILERLLEETSLLNGLEGPERRQGYRTCMRLAHNLKGAAMTVGSEDVAQIAHGIEDLLARLAESNADCPADTLALIGDAVALALRCIEGSGTPADVRELCAALSAPSTRSTAQAPASPPSRDHSSCAALSRKGAGQVADLGAHSVRVDTKRLDRLMEFSGEMLSMHAGFVARTAAWSRLNEELLHGSRTVTAERDLAALRARLPEYLRDDKRSVALLGRLSADINATLKQLRMMPLTLLAPQWRRTVDECARSLNKTARLTVDLGDVEVDKQVLERLSDPMMHLLRNALDHGIEPAEERLAGGKEARGHIHITAAMQGTLVRMELSDDGRGLDVQRIATHALKQGLIEPADIDKLPREKAVDLIFRSGFSTAQSVTSVSGRGVGLDVVRRRMEELGGAVIVEPTGHLGGTTFVLTVPSSLISVKGLLLRVASATYAMPIDCVVRTTRVAASELRLVDGRPVLGMRDEPPLTICELDALLGHPTTPKDSLNVVILALGTERMGLAVDEILEEREFVVKRLPWNLRAVTGVNGAVLLVDGSLAIALDVVALFSLARRDPVATPGTLPGGPGARPTPPAGIRRKRILLVDDSLTARALSHNVLTRAGHEVVQAADGVRAWELLESQRFDLVVSDIEMPLLDGLELTKKIRSRANLRTLPVILLTARGSQEDVVAGANAGADEYIVKGELETDKLLRAVARLV